MSNLVVEHLLQRLSAAGSTVASLLGECQDEEYEDLWRQDSRLYRAFGKKLIAASHYTRAFELVREGLRYHPQDTELQYQRALALARGGNGSKASEYAEELLHAPNLDPRMEVQALSLLGRLSKDRYARSSDPVLKSRLAEESSELYGRAYQLSRDSFPGINAATMSLLAGDPDKARRIASEVVEQVQAELQQPGKDTDYWMQATLGEAHVILGEPDAAALWYKKAVENAAGEIGDITSMRRNLQLLQQKVPVSDELLQVFDIGRVVVFAGHMIDHPDRLQQGSSRRFPSTPQMEERVRGAIREKLETMHAVVGYCSAACGSDILFAECMLERGAELHLMLPYNREDFYHTSVDFGLPEMTGWRERCDRVLKAATDVHYATNERFLGDPTLLEFVNMVTQGLAITRASQLGVEPSALVVLDKCSAALLGGTAYFVESWTAGGREAHLIDLAALRLEIFGRSSIRPSPAAQPVEDSAARPVGTETPPPNRIERQIKAMLFADVKNYSQLSEEQAPSFFVGFLNAVSEVLKTCRKPPAFRNTWGDGLFMVFDQVVDCADFALRLLDRILTMDWEHLKLPADTTVRIGVHAGPVYSHPDPIIERNNFFGSHVNRAARIEPVTPPGCAFTSEQFAAMLAVQPDHRFVCEYIATQELAKKFDRCALYRLEQV